MTVDEPPPAESVGVGERIRAAREAARISVRELARRADVSPSHVSQVERGLASFSVRTLYKVASELGLSMDMLFDEVPAVETIPAGRDGSAGRGSGTAPSAPNAEDPLVANGTVLRADDRPTIPLAGGTRWERLTARPENGAEFIEVVYPPAGPNSNHPKDFIQHSSREYGLVLSGTLTVQVGFETTKLPAGDSIVFNSVVPASLLERDPGRSQGSVVHPAICPSLKRIRRRIRIRVPSCEPTGQVASSSLTSRTQHGPAAVARPGAVCTEVFSAERTLFTVLFARSVHKRVPLMYSGCDAHHKTGVGC